MRVLKYKTMLKSNGNVVITYDRTMITTVEYTLEEGYSFDSLEIQSTDDVKVSKSGFDSDGLSGSKFSVSFEE